MTIMEIALLVAGLMALVVGYWKNHRNLLLTASILLVLAAGLRDVFDGFIAGFRDAMS
jgi:phosphatidylglycerophosphate synthase